MRLNRPKLSVSLQRFCYTAVRSTIYSLHPSKERCSPTRFCEYCLRIQCLGVEWSNESDRSYGYIATSDQNLLLFLQREDGSQKLRCSLTAQLRSCPMEHCHLQGSSGPNVIGVSESSVRIRSPYDHILLSNERHTKDVKQEFAYRSVISHVTQDYHAAGCTSRIMIRGVKLRRQRLSFLTPDMGDGVRTLYAMYKT